MKMAKQGTSTVVPRLRFPEFQRAAAWEVGPFSTILTIGNGKDYKHLSSGPVPVYGSGGYMLSVSDYLYDGESACIGRKGSINNPIFLSGKFWTVDTLFYTHSFKGCLPRFVFLHFQQINWLKHNEAGGVPSLSKANIEKIEVAIPDLAEQQKIADCLTSLDEVITAQGRKVEALKAHKRGLMQQLFPREGETRPRLRFPEFRNAPEWEEGNLVDVARLRNGYAFKSSDYVESGSYQIITIANVQQGDLALESTKKIAALPSDMQQHQILRRGDILISMTGNVGRVCRVTEEDLLLNQRVGKLVPLAINPAFFYQLLQCDEFRRTMQLKAAGGAQGNLSASDIAEYVFGLPLGPDEQQRIADFLSSLDAQIAAETNQLATLKTHKQGLMQQLFPSPETANA